MSRTSTLIILSLLTIIGFAFSNLKKSEKRLIFNQETAASRLHITNKLNSGINVTIFPTDNDKMEAGRDFGLTVEVRAPMLIHNAKLAWKLPPNIMLVSGLNQQVITELKPDEPQRFSIVIRSSTADNARVHARILVEENGKRFNEIARYNTVFQEDIDEQKAELAKRTLKAIEGQQGPRLKIYK